MNIKKCDSNKQYIILGSNPILNLLEDDWCNSVIGFYGFWEMNQIKDSFICLDVLIR